MNTVTAIVRTLLKYAHKEGSGQTVLLNLRSYPAVLVVTAYGVGLVDAHRWNVLHDFLSESVNDASHGETSRIVECLFLGAWQGYEHRLWQTLEGLEQHKTPLSDHLCELLERWSGSFTSIVTDFEELYESWEVAGSLAYAEKYTKSELEVPDHSRGTLDSIRSKRMAYGNP